MAESFRRARVVAFQILYGTEMNPEQTLPEEMIRERVRKDADQMAYAKHLILGVQRDQARIDERITRALQKWSLSRLAPVDRCILRVGVYELLEGIKPPAQIMNEAIEIAKEFGDKNSGSFVNGVIDRVYKEYLAEQGEA